MQTRDLLSRFLVLIPDPLSALAPLALRLPRHSAPPPMRPHRQSLVDHSSANPRFSWPSPSWFCRHQFLRRPPSGHIGWPLNGWCGYNTKEATG
ncbi:hypothetical protein DAI22_07g095500 [Oryza sativa Japonica Group]|nr:hypothetical protein DAI22_07g095500 [Oryza sativa Japonica Group]